ncbi:SDR family NAD(P)-dependent oxidoreductase [Chloroflexota bacterium]
MKLENKVAIVTGGGVGIGEAISLAFALEGTTVVAAARTLPRLEAVVNKINANGGKAIAIQTDVTDENQIKMMVDQTISTYGKIDILVNNSGIAGPTTSVVDMPLDEWNDVLAINLTGSMLCAREVLKYMLPRKTGNIINISSMAGVNGLIRRSPYCASKWGIIGLTQTLALECGEHNIRVNCIAPGAVEGQRIDNVLKARAKAAGHTYEEEVSISVTSAALRKIVTANEIARTALFLVSDDSSGMTGQILKVNAGTRL